MDFIHSMFLALCLLIDKMIYSINKLLFNLFYHVSLATFPQEVYSRFFNNIYIAIGIFMMFKVAFSLIQMVANPDMIADKEKGLGKITTRVVIVLALITMVPTIFSMAYELQAAILRDGIIEQLILGRGSSSSSEMEKKGGELSIQVFKGMISVNGETDDDDVRRCKEALEDHENFPTITSLEKVDGSINCFTEKTTVGDADEYIYDYKFLVSSIATGMVTWFLVGYCIDVGVRLVKLMFLQLIAPVCIVTYIGGGKDNSFGKWIKMTLSTYVSVFVKLVVIYFVIYISKEISENLGELGLANVPLGQVAVILGLLVFAKNAPKLIGDLFGVKLDEESGFKGIAKTALLGGAALTAGGGLAGISNIARGFGNTVNAVKDAKKNGASGWAAGFKGAGNTLLSAMGGMAAGAFYGAKNGFGKNATLGGSINKALMTSNANREQRADRKSIGYSFGDRMKDLGLGAAGIDTTAKKGANAVKNRLAGLQQSRSAAAQQQYELSKSVNPGLLQKINEKGYNYSAFDEKWYDKSGKEVSNIYSELGVKDVSGFDFEPLTEVAKPIEISRDDYVSTSSVLGLDGNPIETFDEAGYNAAMENYNAQMAEYNEYKLKQAEYAEMVAAKADNDYLHSIEQIAGLDKDIITTQKELGKWEKEQNAVERKTSSGNK